MQESPGRRAQAARGARRRALACTVPFPCTWLATAQADLVRKQWRAPEAGRRTVGAYADDYLERSDLREGTRALYAATRRLHLAETWHDVAVADVTAARVRQWHERATKTTKPTALAQAYRLLRALLNVAVADEVLATNPCRLRSAASPKPARPSRRTRGELARLDAAAGEAWPRRCVPSRDHRSCRFQEVLTLSGDALSNAANTGT